MTFYKIKITFAIVHQTLYAEQHGNRKHIRRLLFIFQVLTAESNVLQIEISKETV